MARKKEMIKCSKCGCELSFQELCSTIPLCFICWRNEEDRKEQRQERQWKYDDGKVSNGT